MWLLDIEWSLKASLKTRQGTERSQEDPWGRRACHRCKGAVIGVCLGYVRIDHYGRFGPTKFQEGGRILPGP